MPAAPIDAPAIVPYVAALSPSTIIKTMMYLETPPRLIETKIFSAMPDSFRRKGVRTRLG